MNRSLGLMCMLSGVAALAGSAWAQTPSPATRPAVPMRMGTRPAGAATRPAMQMPPTTLPAPTEVIVTVNDTKITEGDLEDYLQRIVKAMGADGEAQAAMFRQQYRGQLLNQLIEDVLLSKEMKGIKVTDEDRDRKGDEILAQTLRSQRKTREQLDAQLAAQNSSIDQRMKSMKSNPGFDRSIMQEKIAEAKFGKDVNITDKDIDDSAKMVRASHILLMTRGKSPEEKEAIRKKAEEIKAEAKKEGADFAALASQHSEDPGSKAKGGDLDFFPRDMMVPAFSAAAFSMKPGEISDLVETPYGYHIIKVTDIKPAPTDKKERDMIRHSLLLEKIREPMQKYVLGLKNDAKIEYAPGKAATTRPAFNMMRPPATPTTRPAAGAATRPS